MPRIKHLAIFAKDQLKMVEFYQSTFGMKQVHQYDAYGDPSRQAYYLSDGYVNLALLKFKADEPAITEGAPRHTGIHHFGVKVDNMEEASARIVAAGAVHRPYEGVDEMEKRGNVEVKFYGPDGVTVDLSADGWAGTRVDM